MAETKESNVPDNEELFRNSWMVRPCVLYKEEYKDCKSIKGRFQQYFVYGKFEDCSSWSQDFRNCQKWQSEKNTKAFKEIIANEEARRNNRLNAHYKNNVWEPRPQPPENWNTPLPEWMEKRNKNTYLDERSKEIKEGKTSVEKSICVIL